MASFDWSHVPSVKVLVREVQQNFEIDRLIAKHVMNWPADKLGAIIVPPEWGGSFRMFKPSNDVNQAFECLNHIGCRLSVCSDRGKPDSRISIMKNYKGNKWSVGVLHSGGDLPSREIYHESLSMALCLAMLYRFGVYLSYHHPDCLYEDAFGEE